MTEHIRTKKIRELSIEDKIKIMYNTIQDTHERHDIKIVPYLYHEIIITVTEKGIYKVDSFLAANWMERIFVKTGYFIIAFSSGENKDGKKYIQFYLNSKFKIKSVNVDGEYWENVKYRAQCPHCDEKELFRLMIFKPEDYRDLTCPKCKVTNSVRSFYVLNAEEQW